MKNDSEIQNFEIFDKVVHKFGKPDEVIIYLFFGLTPLIGDRRDTVSPLLKTKQDLNIL